ncbi:MAG: CapA family protein [bacterium]
MMRRIKILLAIIVLAIAGFGVVWALAKTGRAITPGSSATSAAPLNNNSDSTTATIAFTGDILMHMDLVRSGYNADAGGYDFTRVFAPVAPYLHQADYAVGNLETRMAGAEMGYSGYPRFNSPDELASGLKASGFTMLATANNHSMDMGWGGIVHTLDTLDAAGLAHIGTARSAEERAAPAFVTIKGIRVAFLNYTAETNELPVPKSRPYAVNLLQPEKILADTSKVRKNGADVVIAVLHFGEEYEPKPNKYQRNIARQLLEGGVDAIIGSHPHVVQPIEKITVQRNGAPYTGVVAFSLGNFASTQRERYRDAGIILYLTLAKNTHGTVVTGTKYLPVWVQQGWQRGIHQARVLPALPDTDPHSDLPLTVADEARLRQVWDDTHGQLEREELGIVAWAGRP